MIFFPSRWYQICLANTVEERFFSQTGFNRGVDTRLFSMQTTKNSSRVVTVSSRMVWTGSPWSYSCSHHKIQSSLRIKGGII